MAILTMTAANLETTMSESDILIIDFWADWCGPCKQFAPIYKKLAEKHTDIVFSKVDTDVERDLSSMFSIASVPTLAILRHGILLFKEAGVQSAEQLEQVIEQVRGLNMDEVRAQVGGG